jgi:hypothetical protein
LPLFVDPIFAQTFSIEFYFKKRGEKSGKFEKEFSRTFRGTFRGKILKKNSGEFSAENGGDATKNGPIVSHWEAQLRSRSVVHGQVLLRRRLLEELGLGVALQLPERPSATVVGPRVDFMNPFLAVVYG